LRWVEVITVDAKVSASNIRSHNKLLVDEI